VTLTLSSWTNTWIHSFPTGGTYRMLAPRSAGIQSDENLLRPLTTATGLRSQLRLHLCQRRNRGTSSKIQSSTYLTVSSGDHYDLSGLFRFSSLSSYNPPVNVKTFVRWWSVIVGKDVFIISVPISLCIECILSARMLCKLVTRENCDESQSFMESVSFKWVYWPLSSVSAQRVSKVNSSAPRPLLFTVVTSVHFASSLC
jgi:hypothetical protein